MSKQRLDPRVRKHTIILLTGILFYFARNMKLTFSWNHQFTNGAILDTIYVYHRWQMASCTHVFKERCTNWDH